MILDNLVLRNLKTRKYYAAPTVTNGDTTIHTPMVESQAEISPATTPVKKPPPSPTSPSTPPLTPDGLGPGQIGNDIDREEVEQVVNRYIKKNLYGNSICTDFHTIFLSLLMVSVTVLFP